MTKYTLISTDKILPSGKPMLQVKYSKEFSERMGILELGGYVEHERNLSQACDCYIGNNARVCGNALVYGNARVYDNALVYGNARVYDNTCVRGNSHVSIGIHADVVPNLILNPFSITFLGTHIQIGCQLLTVEEWLKVTKKQAVKMGLPENKYKQYKALIKALLIKE